MHPILTTAKHQDRSAMAPTGPRRGIKSIWSEGSVPPWA
ncbi:MAG: hypothetical protein F4085_04585 [Acidimicrobiia bacterium]|nr:hypothetical protein [Acidimicrobiia bacterium]